MVLVYSLYMPATAVTLAEAAKVKYPVKPLTACEAAKQVVLRAAGITDKPVDTGLNVPVCLPLNALVL